jgi:hypothetical protein
MKDKGQSYARVWGEGWEDGEQSFQRFGVRVGRIGGNPSKGLG